MSPKQPEAPAPEDLPKSQKQIVHAQDQHDLALAEAYVKSVFGFEPDIDDIR